MRNWRSLLYGFTGLWILIGIWTPLGWLISNMRNYHQMETFDLFRMHPLNVILCVTLALITLVAQLGFLLIAQDHAEFERAAGRTEAD